MITDNTKTLYNALEHICELTAERDKYRDACERLIEHYGGIEQWNSQRDQYGNFSPERDEYCYDSENGFDFARQVKAEIDNNAE